MKCINAWGSSLGIGGSSCYWYWSQKKLITSQSCLTLISQKQEASSRCRLRRVPFRTTSLTSHLSPTAEFTGTPHRGCWSQMFALGCRNKKVSARSSVALQAMAPAELETYASLAARRSWLLSKTPRTLARSGG